MTKFRVYDCYLLLANKEWYRIGVKMINPEYDKYIIEKYKDGKAQIITYKWASGKIETFKFE